MNRLDRLHPYFPTLLAAASACARRLFADEVTLEHLLVAAIEDEESAANQVVCHAFADPETVALEALALAPGLMVVGSAGALPFSPLSVEALRAARARAAAAGWAAIDCGQLLRASLGVLPEPAAESLRRLGVDASRLEGSPGAAAVAEAGPLFRFFDTPAKRALSLASKLARTNRESSIGPARMLIASLDSERELEARCGLTLSRARIALAPFGADTSPVPTSEPALEAGLAAFLEALPEGAGSLELLEACHRPETQEVAALLARHKVHPALLQRARESFEDPTP